jgi:hypothetical protein
MFGMSPYGITPFGAPQNTGSEAEFPAPSGGGASRLLLMGVRALPLAFLLWAAA